MPRMTDAPSTPLTRDELRAYALSGGVHERVRRLEREIARLQREFPEVLIDGPIALLKAELRTDGKAWGGAVEKPAAKRTAVTKQKMKRAWTPARRKKQAARMRKNHAKLTAAKMTKRDRTTSPIWQQMQAALQHAPDHRATTSELIAVLGIESANPHATIANAVANHEDLFKRVEPGVFALTAAGRKASENGAEA